MYNPKQFVAAALSTDATLLAKIPKTRMFDGQASFTAAPIFPYLIYYELTNIESEHADDEEIASEVTIRVDIYGTSSLSTTAADVNRIMKALGYGRNYSRDQDEVLDNGQPIKHKIMSFTTVEPL